MREKPGSAFDDGEGATGGPGQVVRALQQVRPKLTAICTSFRFFDETEDLIQEAALLALENKDAIRELEGWLIGVVWRLCVRAAQHRKRNEERREPWDDGSVDRERIEPTTLFWLETDRLRRTLARRDWELLWWIFCEKLSFREIGQKRSCSVKSIGMMKRRALARARAVLAGQEGRARSCEPVVPARLARSLQGRDATAARDRALRGLQALGLTCGDLVRLELADLRIESEELVVRRSAPEIVSLSDPVAQLLQAWLKLRGHEPGPLFVSWRKKERMTERGLKITLARRFPCARPAERVRREQRKLRPARNRLLALLHRQDLSHWSLSELRIEDVRETGILVDGALRPLATEVMVELSGWISLQDRSEGPLFVNVTRQRGMMSPREIRKILKRQGVFSSRRTRSKVSGNPARQLRDRILAGLFQAGIGPSALSRLRVEDVRESGLLVKGVLHPLPEAVMGELRAWLLTIERSSGPLIVSAFGKKTGAISAARISQILGSQRLSTMRDPACLLWEALPRELQRRAPSNPEEVALVAQRVQEACGRGVELAQALRLSGLSLDHYRAWEKANGVREKPALTSEVNNEQGR